MITDREHEHISKLRSSGAIGLAANYELALMNATDDMRALATALVAAAFTREGGPGFLPPLYVDQATVILTTPELKAEVHRLTLPAPITYRHIKRGGLYTIIGTAVYHGPGSEDEDDLYIRKVNGTSTMIASFWPKAEGEDAQWCRLQTNASITSGALLTIYEAQLDGSLWGRPVSEFFDGRFEVAL